MDALKLLKEEANRKRKALQETAALKGKKYVKRAELEAIDTGKEGKVEVERVEVGESSASAVVSPTTPTPATPGDDNPVFAIPRTEVVRRLRERGEPIRLFGESDKDVCLRLRQIEILAPEVNKGLRNDLKDAMDKLDQEYLTQIAMQQGEEGADSAELRVRDDGTTLEEIMKLWLDLKTSPTDDQKQELCLKTLKFMLKEWAAELNARAMTDKRSYQGKLDSATFKQTEAYLKPLFKQLKKKSIAADILTFLSDICGNLLEREYVKANDIYLQMAIGNAPWPIGVTMVGIHARTGREKIFAQQIAHVLNDETQRKYIQGVKRLMTFCQRKYSTVPSKCVEYNGLKPRSS